MAYYDDLKSRNVIRLLKEYLKGGAMSLRGSDGKFVANLHVDWDSPWIHIRNSYETNCFWWKDIVFHQIVEKHLPRDQWFVPIGCQNCFKVVVRPKTIEGLFALEALEERLDRPSKCGIELRSSVFGNYGGYFYNRGLPAGLECYKEVRAAVDADPALGPEITVLLKRACTEMELAVGRSDHWEVKPEQMEFETRFQSLIVNDLPVLRQSEHVKDEVRQKWIERAYDVGDETVLQYNGGQPLFPEYVTYHHLSEKENAKNGTGMGPAGCGPTGERSDTGGNAGSSAPGKDNKTGGED